MSAKVYLPEELGGLGWRVDTVSYAVWLTLTSQDRWALSKLKKELHTFTGPEKQPYATVEALMKTKVEYFENNVAPLSPSEWDLLGYSTDINHITNLPIGVYGERPLPYTPLQHMTFVEVLDKNYLLTEDCSNLDPIWNRYGFVNRNEKPFNGQSCNYRSSTNVSDSKERREKGIHPGRVFNFKTVKRLWREATGETKGELERVLQTSLNRPTKTNRTERNSNGEV
jgi:hypothetical protein